MKTAAPLWLALLLAMASCAPTAPLAVPRDDGWTGGRHSDEPPREGADEQEPAEIRLVELPLPKGAPAIVSEPSSSGGPHPVLVATHGAGGRAEVHCAIWRTILGPRGFILCPRGVRMGGYDDAWFYDGYPALGREISLALEALASHYGKRVDLQAPLFAGYSQGAAMGSRALPDHPARFAAAVLIEGGFGAYQEWNVASARRFRERGAKRVLIACGRVGCRKLGSTTAKYMERGGLETRLVYADVGHWFGDELYEEVRSSFAWLVAGDDRW